jgi:ribosomal protein S6
MGFFTTLLNPSNSHCKFNDNDEAQEEVMTLFKGQVADFYDLGIQKLVPRLNKCLDNAGDYVEK